MFAKTQRLLLRPGWIEDAPALAQAFDAESVRYKFGADFPSFDEDSAARYLATTSRALLPDLLIQAHGGGSALVGGISLEPLVGGRVEFKCWISAGERRRGFAVEAGRAMMDIARHALGFRQIIGIAQVGQQGAESLLGALGFKRSGCRMQQDRLGEGLKPSLVFSRSLDDHDAALAFMAA